MHRCREGWGCSLPVTASLLPRQHRPVLITLGTILQVFAACYTHVCVRVFHVAGYQLWQPFRGGLSFVLLQGFGWLFIGLLLDLSISIVSNGLAVVRWGVTVLGCVGHAGVILVVVSIPTFVPDTVDNERKRSPTAMSTVLVLCLHRTVNHRGVASVGCHWPCSLCRRCH